MNSKEVLDRAYSNIPREIGVNYTWEFIPAWRGMRYYYLKVKRFFTR